MLFTPKSNIRFFLLTIHSGGRELGAKDQGFAQAEGTD